MHFIDPPHEDLRVHGLGVPPGDAVDEGRLYYNSVDRNIVNRNIIIVCVLLS